MILQNSKEQFTLKAGRGVHALLSLLQCMISFIHGVPGMCGPFELLKHSGQKQENEMKSWP